jgi:hypothetical protein
VVSGWSSGTTALPGRVLTIGLASASAVSSTSWRAPRAPVPTSMATLPPRLRTSAARRRSPSRGTAGGGLNAGAVTGRRPGATDRHG